MSVNIEKAVRLLKSNNYTFAAVSDKDELTSVQRGVKPLLELYEKKVSLSGFSAADKVIGKAAAFLYVLLAPDGIYADVISRPALSVLGKYHIEVSYGMLVQAIKNRGNTGFCPMETAVSEADNPDDALVLIYRKLETLH